jgi:hypothetical protein
MTIGLDDQSMRRPQEVHLDTTADEVNPGVDARPWKGRRVADRQESLLEFAPGERFDLPNFGDDAAKYCAAAVPERADEQVLDRCKVEPVRERDDR